MCVCTLLASGGVEVGEEQEAAGKKPEEPWFPSKLSACNLFPAIYTCLPKEGMADEKVTLLENFAALSDDEMPMVRSRNALT